MTILHILSQKEVTGAETYATSLADFQVTEGHQVFIISDTLLTSTSASYIPHPISNRRLGQRLKNILFLRKFILTHHIDLVHAHSRAASWVAFFAIKKTGATLISTIHGRQHLHRSTKLFPHIYGNRVITVCDNLRTHLIEEVGIPSKKIFVIPNGFDFKKKTNLMSSDSFILTLAGRTTGPKGERLVGLITRVLPHLCQKHKHLQVKIIGGQWNQLPEEAIKIIEKINQNQPNQIHWVGFTKDLPTHLSESHMVIASGRIAIETLAMDVPLLALGESCYHGLITEENLTEGMASNFGDIIAILPLPPLSYDLLRDDIDSIIKTNNTPRLDSEKIRQNYTITHVVQRVMDSYYSAVFKKRKPKHIPILMYHKIPINPIDSPHRIFVTQDQFEKHLVFFQRKKLTPITFEEYDAYKHGLLPLTSFPSKPIFLTFDDAYLDNYTNAFPLLKKYGYKATIFSLGDEKHTTNFWDVEQGETAEPLMTTAQKKTMQDYGIEFGSHTLNHKDLTQLTDEVLSHELTQSKLNLEHQLGKKIISFAYPYGKCDARVKKYVEKAGYRYAVVIDSGGLHLEDDPLELFRAYIFPEDGPRQLRKKTTPWYRRYFKWKRGR